LGTPAITSRGFEEPEARQVARLIVEVLTAMDDETVQRRVAAEVKELTSRFPVPGLDL
jgi:glycine hydroxymethyltransferase